jgi:5-methylthioadenosine/S-adenosylhomocysteine deaminase
MALNELAKIIENGIVATADQQNRVGRYALLIRNDRIVDIAPRSEPLKNLYPNAEVIDAGGKLVVPGFVDPHFHAESFLLRHFTGTIPMSRWSKDRRIAAVYSYLNDKAAQEDLEILYRLAYFNALKSGVTCVADYGLDNLEKSILASFEAMKRVELKGFIGLHNGDQVEQSRELQSSSVRFALTLPSEDDLTTYGLQSILRISEDLKMPLMVHLGETKRGSESLRKNFHRSTTQLLKEFHLLGQKIQLSHLSVLENDDAEILSAAKTSVIITPNSAVRKEVDLPPIGEFMMHDIPLALGTDWGLVDPFSNVRAIAALARVHSKSLPSGFEMLALCTRNGAQALGLLNESGSLEPGKKADIAFIDISDVRWGHNFIGNDLSGLLSSVFLEGSTRDVTDVMVNGNFCIRERNILTYSEEDLLQEGSRLMAKLVEHSSGRESATSADALRSTTPILSLEPARIEDDSEEYEDGFRIIKKEDRNNEPSKKVTPVRTEHPKQVEIPKPVKKVFGEDDL